MNLMNSEIARQHLKKLPCTKIITKETKDSTFRGAKDMEESKSTVITVSCEEMNIQAIFFMITIMLGRRLSNIISVKIRNDFPGFLFLTQIVIRSTISKSVPVNTPLSKPCYLV